MAHAAYKTQVKFGIVGTPTRLQNAQLVASTNGRVWSLDPVANAAPAVWDSLSNIDFQHSLVGTQGPWVDAVIDRVIGFDMPVPPDNQILPFGVSFQTAGGSGQFGNAGIDFLNRRIIGNSRLYGFIRVTAYQRAITYVGSADQFQLDIGGDILDETTFKSAAEDNGFRSRTYGLNDISLTVEGLRTLTRSTKNLLLFAITERQEVIVEIITSSGTQRIRGYFIAESDTLSGDVGSLEREAISFQMTSTQEQPFSWITIPATGAP